MKKGLLTVFAAVCSITAVVAQDQKTPEGFNRWSIDLNGGLSKPTDPFTKGYATEYNFNHADVGVRYMLNNKFGLKADFGYDVLKPSSGSSDFNTKYSRIDLQGVINLGRVLDFETWTRCLNLQAHSGLGYSWMTGDTFNGQDKMANLILGLTGQIKLSERFALNADASIIKNARQSLTFNGATAPTNTGFDGTMYNATIGLSIYLGSQKHHADWHYDQQNNEMQQKINSLENRVSEIEKNLNDTDRDGVADYADTEPNTATGLTVDTKGRAVDRNNNGVPDEIEPYMDKTYARKDSAAPVAGGNQMNDLINSEYINVYFDVNSTEPTEGSVNNLNYIVKYLKSNPSAKAELNGFADEIGGPEYNKTLSTKRAESVKDILVKSGISADRLTVVGKGVDNSVDASSKNARKMVRRVSFKITN
ncbi:MAG: OmpA family protein [Flavobacterium sp.]